MFLSLYTQAQTFSNSLFSLYNMYCRAKPFKDENHKPRKSHRNTPSFSSTLLDEIYRSIDSGGNADKAADAENSAAHRSENLRSNNGGGGRRSTTGDNHEKATARFPRACLVRNNGKDLLSSFGSTTAKSEVSRPYNTNPNHNKSVRMEEDCHHQLTKSKSRALKVYTKLKKMKQPISPGKRLTNFINSLFTNLNSKKFKNQDLLKHQSPKVSSSTPISSTTYSSSASSLSTPSSILDKNKKTMMTRNNNNDQKYYGRPPLPPNALANHRNTIRRESDFSMFEKVHYEDKDEDDDDGVSDSSSDLFELDHLVLFGNNNIFCQELPVYETTYFDKNCAVASGLF